MMISHQIITEFLLAARYGNGAKTKEMIELHGIELVNKQDNFGTSALHLAVIYGHSDVVNLLLSQSNIDVNLKSYEDIELESHYTPLDMAIKYHQPKHTIEMLLNAGASTTNTPEQILEWLFGSDLLSGTEENNLITVGNSQSFEQAINILEILVKKTPQMLYVEDMPLTVTLKVVSAYLTDAQAKLLVQKLIDNIVEDDETNDNIEISYLLAKDFTHAFASDKNYDVINSNFEGVMAAEGHLPPFVVQSFLDAVVDYGYLANYTDLKITVFAELNATYHAADFAVKNAGLYDTSKMLYQMYSEGKTILLPTTWEKHAIDIILDKKLGLYLVANAGERHETLFPGVHAYKNTSPIEVDDIYHILTSGNQYNLEYENYYKLGLVEEPDFSQTYPDQVYGNCGLYSLLMANWSLTYINIYKYTDNPILSRELADLWHKDVIEHHKTLVLEKYLSQPYFADDKPLYDALTVYESKLDHPEKFEQTTLLLDYLTSSEHVIEFRDFHEQNQQAFSPELTSFMKKRGYESVLHPDDILTQMAELDLGDPETLISQKSSDLEGNHTTLIYCVIDLNKEVIPVESFA